jgi:hypothetical protein
MILFRGCAILVVVLPRRPLGARRVNLSTIESLPLFSVADQTVGGG